MKHAALTLTVFCAFCAAAFAVDTLCCKWRGSSSFSSLRQLISSLCSRSPIRKHELCQGAPRRFYVCFFCATEAANFTQLVASPCSKSPSKYHQACEGAEKAFYTCKTLRPGVPQFQAARA
ncbi:MAG: hypothetical protein LBD37_10020 [Treponema sp.]|nr:hypothetical protein [Treponema sp.]